MTRALFLKELRELRPWGLLSLVLGALDLVPALTSQLDMQPLSYTIGKLDDEITFICWVLALALGTGLSTREQDDRTLTFLDGLPVSRSRVFLVKYCVTVALVMLAPVMRFAISAVEHLLSRGSLDYALRPGLLLQLFGLQLLLIVHGVTVGAAVGRLRHLTWLVVGSTALLFVWLIKFYPALSAVNPLQLVEVPITGAGLAIDATTVWVQAGVALAAFGIAWLAFVHAGRSVKLLRPPPPLVSALVTGATVVVIFIAFVLLQPEETRQAADAKDDAQAQPTFETSPPAQTSTRHYEFSYPAHTANKALALVSQADAIFERVHVLLHVTPGQSIAVDATGSMTNTAGTAFFGRIRMALDDDPPANIVLAHETAHVVARRIAGNVTATKWNRANVLDEGLAWWVDSHFEGAQPRADGLLVLAALHERRQLRIAQMFDAVGLQREYGPDLQYPAGEALIAATVRLYGEDSLPRLLAAFADARIPGDLGGEPLWQSAFQLAQMDLGAVVDEFYREIAAYARERAAVIAALPRVRVRVIEYEGDLGIQPLLDSNEPQRDVLLRFKPEPDSDLELMDADIGTTYEPVWRKAKSISGGKICVQAGIRQGEQVLYEPWTCLPTADAAEWEPPEDEEEEEE